LTGTVLAQSDDEQIRSSLDQADGNRKEVKIFKEDNLGGNDVPFCDGNSLSGQESLGFEVDAVADCYALVDRLKLDLVGEWFGGEIGPGLRPLSSRLVVGALDARVKVSVDRIGMTFGSHLERPRAFLLVFLSFMDQSLLQKKQKDRQFVIFDCVEFQSPIQIAKMLVFQGRLKL
jgi:hypothetical protein